MLAMLHAPLTGHNVGCGIQSDWAGLHRDMSRFEIGVSELRAAGAARKLEDKGRERAARLGELRES